MKFTIWVTLSLILLAPLSCKKDESTNVGNTGGNKIAPIESPFTYNKGTNITASFFGSVVDENQQVISGATVTIGNKTIETDENGVFQIKDASVFENHAYITARKDGFFLGSRSLVPTSGVNKVRIRMLKQEPIGTFDASSGGSVSGDGITINFKPGVVDAYGQPYSGKVNVYGKYIDPEGEFLQEEMPGNLVAANEEGSKVLKTFGMVAVQLTGSDGSELQLGKNSPAEITFPLSATLIADAPSEIALWYFDEVNGFWSQEGTAKLEGNTYKAEVSHFSFWNCDIPVDAIKINGRVVDESGNPVPDLRLNIISTSNGGRGGFTDDNGRFRGLVPANQNLTLQIIIKCGVAYSKNLGSFSSNTTLSDVIFNLNNEIIVSGTIVDCNLNPVIDGYVKDDLNNVYKLTAGKFNIIRCPNTTLFLKGVNINDKRESGLRFVMVTSKSIDVGNIQTCDSINEYITWTSNGKAHIALDKLDVRVSPNGKSLYVSGIEPDRMAIAIVNEFIGVGSYVLKIGSESFVSYDSDYDLMNKEDNGTVVINVTKFNKGENQLFEANFRWDLTGIDNSPGSRHIERREIVTGSMRFYDDY